MGSNVRTLRPDAPDDGTVRVVATFWPGPDGIDVAAVFDQLLEVLGPAGTAEVLEAGARLARSRAPAGVA